jgi:hypothetical protein
LVNHLRNYASKKWLYFIKIDFHAICAVWDCYIFCYSYFITSWNQVDALHWKRMVAFMILIFVIVLSVPIVIKIEPTVTWR